ncbi:hypothetical protein B0H15DRAFT_785801 [Mycena belliarum]|uniref:Uncharacterized protein n=1 Tax=Mycena belliarum TaxID=1033014 RepID=A0AAD6XMZ3_9AGAR|nr:hypothetical protein B0H15DRAFT_785801 [Mycena belliae]
MNNLSSLPIPARLLASGSGPASPPVAIKVEPPSPPPQTVNSKRKWTPSPDTASPPQFKYSRLPSRSQDPDSEEDETPSKKLKPPPPSQPHLVEFFAAYPKFEYDPAGPSSQQFNQLREVYDLRRGRPGADMAYRGFTRAMGLSFTELYGDDVNSLESWHKLCRAVEIEPVPDCIEDCRRAIDELHVNLVDLVDTHNTCARVHRSPSEWDLSAYTVATKKFFPRTLDFNSSLLRYLLRQIFDPPPANLARQGNT